MIYNHTKFEQYPFIKKPVEHTKESLGKRTTTKMRMQTWTQTAGCGALNTTESIVSLWSLSRGCNKSWIFLVFSLGNCTFLVLVSHVQSHPGLEEYNPGWLWTQPIFKFQKVIRYHEYNVDLLSLCDHYTTHGIQIPKIGSRQIPKVWPLFKSHVLCALQTKARKACELTYYLKNHSHLKCSYIAL